VTTITIPGLANLTQIFQYRIAPQLEVLARELKRYNDTNRAASAAAREAAKETLARIEAERDELTELQQAPWEYRILGRPFEKLQCLNGDCHHTFLVDMTDLVLHAGAAAWVWCPLCKTKVPLHTEEKTDEAE
tara:strand:+ start:1937 stop:2335 length:399 start_codon:yes stop_codon:yes gene_type:complete